MVQRPQAAEGAEADDVVVEEAAADLAVASHLCRERFPGRRQSCAAAHPPSHHHDLHPPWGLDSSHLGLGPLPGLSHWISHPAPAALHPCGHCCPSKRHLCLLNLASSHPCPHRPYACRGLPSWCRVVACMASLQNPQPTHSMEAEGRAGIRAPVYHYPEMRP